MKKTFTILSTLACCLLLVSGLTVNNVYGLSPVTNSAANAVIISGSPNSGNALLLDGNYATFENTDPRDVARYNQFGFSIPAGSTIIGFEVLLTGYGDTRNLAIRASKIGSGSYSSPVPAEFLGNGPDETIAVGSPTDIDFWGLGSWTPGDIESDNFTIQLAAAGGSGIAYVNHIQVRVYYSISPQITLVTPLPDFTTINTDPGECFATVNLFDYVDEVTGYPIPELTFHYGAPAVRYPAGDHNQYLIPTATELNSDEVFRIYAHATNGYGADTEPFDLSIEDNEDPVITCPGDVAIVGCSTDAIEAEGWLAYSESEVFVSLAELQSQGIGDATDNCGIGVISYQDVSSGTCFTAIIVTRTWTVTDDEGNSDTCEQVFTITADPVVMNEPAPETSYPVCNDQSTVNDAFALWLAGFTSSGGCNLNVTTDPESPTAPDRCGGTTVVTWTGTSDCEDPMVVVSSFTVVDDEPAEFIYISADEIYIGPWVPEDQDVDLPSSSVCVVLVDWTTPWVVDECVSLWATPTITVDPYVPVVRTVVTTFGSFSPGVYTVTYSYADFCANVTSQSFTITVNDIFPPTLTGGQILDIVDTTDPNICTAYVSWSEPTPGDACGASLSTEITLPGGSPFVYPGTNYNFPVGTSTVTFIATDVNGLQTTRSFNVTVTDNQFPEFTCPVVDAITVSNDPGECYAELDYTVFPTDNCEIGTITYTIMGDSGLEYELVATAATLTATFDYQYPVGVWTVYIDVEDVNGNVTSCDFEVTVEDDEDPVVAVTPITRSLDGTGDYVLDSDDIDEISAGSTDNCDIDYVTVFPNEFDCDDIGDNVVTVTVYDIHGNSATLTSTVIIVDDENPVVYCFAPVTEPATEGECFWTVPSGYSETWGLPTGDWAPSDNCGIVSKIYSLSGATDNSELMGSNEDIRGQQFNVGVTYINWTVIDGSDNEATCTFTLTITDTQPPTLSCVGDQVVDTDPGVCSYEVKGTEFDAFEVDDNCAVITLTWELTGDTTGSGFDELVGVIFEKGITTVTWTAIDASLNETSCSFTVTVEDNEKPSIICPAPIVLEASSGSCTKEHTWLRPLATDNCPGTIKYTITSDANPSISFQTTTNPDLTAPNNIENTATFPVGITMVTYTVEDANGNTNSCTFSVTVDAYSPVVAKAQDIIVQLDEFGVVTITALDIDDGSIVPCLDGDPIDPYLSLSQYVFGCSHVGVVNVVTLTVTDKSGRIDTATATVTVEDVTLPLVYAEPIVDLYVDEFGTATLTVADVYINATDACDINTSTMYVEPSNFTCADIGAPITYTLWVQDVNDNWGFAQGLVNVHDDLAPVMACTITGTITVGTSTNTCDYTHADASWDLTATDNCGAVTVTYSLDGATVDAEIVAPNTTLVGQVFNLGVTTVTWTAVDAYNNPSTCTFYVEVVDDVYPTIACVTDTFRYNDTGECIYTVQGDEFDPDFDDNCSATIEHDYQFTQDATTLAGAEFPIGTTDVVWTVTDGAGNQVSCTITIQVDDQDDPVWKPTLVFNSNNLTCGGTIILYGCNPQLTWFRPGLDDVEDCTNVEIIETLEMPGDFISNIMASAGAYNYTVPNTVSLNVVPGIYTVTYTATDDYENSSTCYFVARVVQSSEPPMITECPADFTGEESIVGCTVFDIDNPVFSDVLTMSDLDTFENNGGEINNICTSNPSVAEVWYIDEIVSAEACPIVVERTWYLIDFIGRTVSCTQTIEVTEDEPPFLIVEGTLPGGYLENTCIDDVPPSPTGAEIAALYNDNCPSATITATLTADELVGTNCGWIVTYTYSVTDDCLNEAIANVVYWGSDSESPSLVSSTLTCNEEFGESDVNECLAVAEQFDAEALEAGIAALYEDNCASEVSATLTNTEAGAENSDCSWVFTYTFTISDGCPANDITCYVVRSGRDSEPPALLSSLTMPIVTDLGNVCIDDIPEAPEVSEIIGYYTDNCGGVTATLTSEVLTGSDCGWTLTFTYAVKDACNNYGPDAVIVYTGRDSEGPFVRNADNFVTHYTCLQAVPEAPEIGVPAANETSLSWTDNCSDVVEIVLVRSLSKQLDCPQTYILTRTWSVTDECDNTTLFDQVITVLDDVPPALIDPAEDTETILARHIDDECKLWIEQTFDATTLEGAVATLYIDNCGTHTATLDASATVITGDDCSWQAVFTFVIEDECFNSVTATVTYTGGNQTPPSGTMPDAIVDMDACAATAEDDFPFDASYAADGYLDNCGNPVTATLTGTGFAGDDCGWIITYTFTVEDDCENALTDQYYTVSGRNQTPPTGTMPVAITGVDACVDEVGVTAALFDAAYAVLGYTDNCGGTVTATNVTHLLTGTDCSWIVTYTFDVEDVCGNALTAQYYTISGSDQTAPWIVGCDFDSPVQVTVTSGCEFVADTRWDVTAYDNCVTPSLTYTLTGDTEGTGSNSLNGLTFDIGTTVVTWTATDGCGLTDVCSFTVIVSVGPPQFPEQLIADQTVNTDEGVCTYTHEGDSWDPEVDDPCDSITLTYELSGATTGSGSTLDGRTFNVGVTTVLWTATDGTLTSTHSYTVTVVPTSLSGYITYYKYDAADLPLGGFTVRLMNDETPIATTTTSGTGYYEFTTQADLLAADRIEVSTTIPHGGLSSGDALAVSMRVATTPPVYWGPETPVDYAKFLDHVGDVHTVLGTLNATDAFVLFQRHVGTRDNFEAGDWAFYATNDETIFTNSSASAAYRMYDMGYCTMNISVRTYGDVRGTYNPVALKSLMPVQSDKVMNVVDGETFELPVTLDHAISFNAVSFYLEYASDKLEVLEVKSDIPGMTTMIENGTIRVEWYDLASQSLSAGDAFITLVARTAGEVTPADLLFNLGSATEFVDAAAQTIPDVEVSVSSLNAVNAITGITDPGQLSVSLDAYPNPFRHELNLRYAIPEAGMVRISVVNMLGAEVASLVNHQHEAGVFTHSFTPNAGSMEDGVYFIRFEVVGESIQTNRIVRVIYNK